MSIDTRNQQTPRPLQSLTEQLTNGHEWAYTSPENQETAPSAPAPIEPEAPSRPQTATQFEAPAQPQAPAQLQAPIQPQAPAPKKRQNRWNLAKGAVLGSAAGILVIGLGSGAAIGWAMGSAAATPDGFGTMQPGEFPGNGEFDGPPQGGPGSGGTQGQPEQSDDSNTDSSGSDYEQTQTDELPTMGS